MLYSSKRVESLRLRFGVAPCDRVSDYGFGISRAWKAQPPDAARSEGHGHGPGPGPETRTYESAFAANNTRL